MTIRAVRVQITAAFLFDLLPFPKGTELLAAQVTDTGDLELAIAHNALPEVPNGRLPPLVQPVFRRATFDDWGLR